MRGLGGVRGEGLGGAGGGAEGKGGEREGGARRWATAAAEVEAGQGVQNAQGQADEHHAEGGVQAGDQGDGEGLEDEGRGHGGADGGDGGDEDARQGRDGAGQGVGQHHRAGGADAHELGRVAVGGDGLEGLAQQGAALEQLDEAHDGEDAHGHGELQPRDVHPEHMDGIGGDGRGEGAVVAPPDVLGGGEEEEAQDDREQDPALALLLEGEADAGPLDDQAQQGPEEQAARDHGPVGQAQVREGEAEEGGHHHQLALPEVDALAGGVGELEAVGDEGVDEAHEGAADGHLSDDRRVHGEPASVRGGKGGGPKPPGAVRGGSATWSCPWPWRRASRRRAWPGRRRPP